MQMLVYPTSDRSFGAAPGQAGPVQRDHQRDVQNLQHCQGAHVQRQVQDGQPGARDHTSSGGHKEMKIVAR